MFDQLYADAPSSLLTPLFELLIIFFDLSDYYSLKIENIPGKELINILINSWDEIRLNCFKVF